MLTVTATSSTNVPAMRLHSRSAIRCPASRSVSGITTANSSPPTRATRSEGRKAVGDFLQHVVAGRVATLVVDPLEVVDVDHHDGNRLIRRAAACDQSRHMRLEVAAVEGARQRVDHRLLEEALVITFLP